MPARAYWKGQIKLALVPIPVEITRTIRNGAMISFRLIHEPSGTPIKYEEGKPKPGREITRKPAASSREKALARRRRA
jgi:DNA end-binding protein Ku